MRHGMLIFGDPVYAEQTGFRIIHLSQGVKRGWATGALCRSPSIEITNVSMQDYRAGSLPQHLRQSRSRRVHRYGQYRPYDHKSQTVEKTVCARIREWTLRRWPP